MAYVQTYKNIQRLDRAMQPMLQDLSADNHGVLKAVNLSNKSTPVISPLPPLDSTVISNTRSTQSGLKAADLQPKPIVIPAAITQTNSTGSEMMDSLASAKTLVGSESYQRAQSGFQSGFQSHSFNSQTIKTR